MYKIKTFTKQALKMYQLVNEEQNSWLTVCPELGGIITEFGVDGQEQLYMDEDTLFDPDKHVRGGIPILFPISGLLEQGEYTWNNSVYEMPIHGFARNHQWEVENINLTDSEASIQIVLNSDNKNIIETSFPFEFELQFTYTIKVNELLIHQQYRNLSDDAMPIYSGFHPYFKTKEDVISIDANATERLGTQQAENESITKNVSVNDMEDSVILHHTNQKKTSSALTDGKRIVIESGPEFRYTVLWSLPGKDFVCVEPWMALPNELNRKEELVMIESKGELITSVSIKVEDR